MLNVVYPHFIRSIPTFQALCCNIQIFMHHVYRCNQRVHLKTQFLPDRLISSSVSLSRLPALFTMFIKWMAVQANGIRYRPRRWQNCSDWLRSFSSFSLFWKWEKINLPDLITGDYFLWKLHLPYLRSVWLFHHHIGLSTFSNITLLQYFFQLWRKHKPSIITTQSITSCLRYCYCCCHHYLEEKKKKKNNQ